MDGFEFAALDTLQHGLARDAERAHRLAHRQEACAGFAMKARLEFVGESDAPGCAGRVLLAGDDAVVEEPVDGRRRDETVPR